MSNADLALMGQVVLGYVMQWARGFRNIPNWATWAVFIVASVMNAIAALLAWFVLRPMRRAHMNRQAGI